MKWLQWSSLDVQKGLGGVEVHMRSLARELSKLGVETHISNDPRELLEGSWDVIQTHGSCVSVIPEIRALLKRRPSGSPLWAHTLHGLTHERMIACQEYFWPGGYGAILKELVGSLNADILFAIHPRLSLFNLLSRTNKASAQCGNGWDSWTDSMPDVLPEATCQKLQGLTHYWIFVGRGDDRMKGVELLIPALKTIPDFRLVAVPGAGFQDEIDVVKLGPLTSGQIRLLMERSQGLILTSRYEGLPLVVLEALSLGIPVVTSQAGGLKTLSPEIEGLFQMEFPTVEEIARAVDQARSLPNEKKDRELRALHNRRYLKTWAEVAKIVYDKTQEIFKNRAT